MYCNIVIYSFLMWYQISKYTPPHLYMERNSFTILNCKEDAPSWSFVLIIIKLGMDVGGYTVKLYTMSLNLAPKLWCIIPYNMSWCLLSFPKYVRGPWIWPLFSDMLQNIWSREGSVGFFPENKTLLIWYE